MKQMFIMCLNMPGFIDSSFYQKNIYHYQLNPIQGIVDKEEPPFRQEIFLNGSCYFTPIEMVNILTKNPVPAIRETTFKIKMPMRDEE